MAGPGALGAALGGLPAEDVLERNVLRPLPEAIVQAHYPDDMASHETARRRLAFDELFLLQMAMLARRRTWQEAAEGVPIRSEGKVLEEFIASLPFSLTPAQERCLGEVRADMGAGTPPMNRLLQGEVGSGKTVVALAALLEAAACGYQGSIMVPTEVLADQHFATVSSLLSGLARPVQEENLLTVYLEPLSAPVSVGLLTGSTRAAVKREMQRRVSEGTLDIIIGTHALIQKEVEMPRLALAVVDEQHRFGVVQRAALRQRGELSPHVLALSATPIPRTLALTLYGDLETSTIDELAPGPAEGADPPGPARASRRRLHLRAKAGPRRPPGLRHLPPHRRLRGRRGQSRHRGVPAPLQRSLSRPARGAAPRTHAL